MGRRAILVVAALGLLVSFPAWAAECGRFGLSVVVDGAAATEYPFRGRTYIEALRGRNFTLRLSNPTGERVAVALSVDGLNVVDAKRTTAREAARWVLDPGQTIEIPGWQVSGHTSRRFFFTETARSYAKWIGDTRNVGTIEAVFFREKRRVIEPLPVAPGTAAPQPMRESSRPAAEGKTRLESAAPQSDSFAATGIGERTAFPVQWVDFVAEPSPAASIALRYEFRPELVRLGVLSREDALYARDRGRGFEHDYAPEPGRRR
jgi:hypothetical protein